MMMMMNSLTHILIQTSRHTHTQTDLVVSCTDMQCRVTASVLLIDVRTVEYQLFHLLNSAALARLHSTEHTHTVQLTSYHHFNRITERVHSRTLRSPAIPLLVQPFTRTDFSRCAFRFSASSLSNLLSQTVLISDSLFTLKNR